MGSAASTMKSILSVMRTPKRFSSQIKDVMDDDSDISGQLTVVTTQAGRWEVGNTIRTGSQGIIRHCKNLEDNCVKGVVKLIRPKSPYKTTPRFSISTDLFRKRVEMEIYAGKTLDHPNICRMYDFWVGDSEAYLLFEFIEGNQLLDIIIQHGKISHRKIRKWCKQLLSALDHCHTHRIAHRDLNVENIMITPKGNLKLIDFGVCCKFDPETKLQEPCGRPWYAAPEIYCNSGYIGPEIDIWSFGVLLYTLVCHKLPFDDESVEGIIEKIKKGQFQLPKHLSWELKDLISRILVVDPSRRANLKEIISHPWLNK